jgi:hypothetical protein
MSMSRGILETMYVHGAMGADADADAVRDCLARQYAGRS